MRPFDQLTLRTDRLILRPLVPSDAEALFAVHSDPRVMRYWSCPPWTDLAQAEENIAKDRRALAAGEYLSLGIELADTTELIGTCSLFDFMPQCRRAELGYGLARACWGRGYMHEALQALLDFGFGELDLHRVEADVDPRNLASTRCLERLGFVLEGHLRERWIVAGEVSDASLYGLLRSDWRGEHFGCEACWPAGAEAAWEARDGLTHLEELIDESHFHVMLLACPHCAQRFVSVFTETIDWADGEDPQSWQLLPVTEAEAGSLIHQQDALCESILNALGPGRRCLQCDHPKAAPEQVLWRLGLCVGAHD